MSNPFFSIIMPTRNRADLLCYSLKCAKAQEFDDFEILVSNNYSSDETEKIILDSLDSRTRYIHTNRSLPMPDSWEFALAHAKGEYILFSCDDDALRPDLLQFLYNLIKKRKPYCVSWMFGVYIHPNWYDKTIENSLKLYSYSQKITECNSETLLKDLFDMKINKVAIQLPKMLNSCCHKDVLNKIKNKLGKIFLPPCPDYSVAAAILTLIQKVLFVESPLFLGGISRKTIGANACRRNEATSAFWNEFGEKSNLFLYTPLKSLTPTNSIVESFLRVKAAMPEQLSQFKLNLISYFIECQRGIEITKEYSNDVTAETEEFYAVLEKQDTKVKESVLAAIERDLRQQKELEKIQNSILRRLKNKLPIKLKNGLSKVKLKILSTNTNKNKRNLYLPKGTIYGSEYGFSNIYECVVKLCEMFPLPTIE